MYFPVFPVLRTKYRTTTFNSDFLKGLGEGISKVGDTVSTVTGIVDKLGSMKSAFGSVGETLTNLGNALGTDGGGGLLTKMGSFLSKIGNADAAKQIRLIEKAKPHAHAAIQQSSLNAEVETRLEQMIESVKESRVMGDINPRFLAFLEDLLKTKVD